MYSSGYSYVSKTGPQSQKKMQYRSKGKSCGYCMRIVFFFSSLIQSLIIVSLVLFLVYGKAQDSPSTARIHDLEESYSRLSIENVALRHQRKNLTNLLNATLTEKARNDWDLARLRHITNISVALIQDLDRKLQQTNRELFFCKSSMLSPNCQAPTTFQVPVNCNCGALGEQLKARLELVNSNFTQSMQRVTMEMEQITKDRDNLNLEAIRLRREKTSHEKELEFFRKRCKEEFVMSLSGIANVSKAFIGKISSLFPANTFHLTCPKQIEHLEQIRTNCTSLSMEIEDKLQRYLNIVGGQVTDIQHENSRLKAENILLTEDYRRCSTNRTAIIIQNKQNLGKLQLKHDEEKERLLMDKMRLNGEIEVLKNNVKYRSKIVDHLTEQIKQLNMSCTLKTGLGGFPGGIPPQTGTQNGWSLNNGGGSNPFGGIQPGRTGSGGLGSSLGSFGLSLNKPASTGTGSSGSSSSFGSSLNKPSTGSGSSLLSSGSSSSAGSSLNKPSTGSGSSFFSSGSSSSSGSSLNKPSTGSGSSLFSSGSSSSSGSSLNKPSTGSGSSLFSSGSSSSSGSSLNKPSTGSGSSFFSSGSSSSSGSSLNKPSTGLGSSLLSTGLGSSKPGSSFGSSSGSSGVGSNKPTTNVKTTSSLGSSSSSSGSTSKSSSSSSGLSSWWGMGSSSSSQSKPGSSTGKGPSTGSSSGGTGSLFGGGRSSGLGSGPVSVAQHLRDLQRIINPSGPEEKQDLSIMLG